MIRFGSVTIPRPVTIASGPLTDRFEKISSAAEAGAGAVSLKLTFVRVPFKSEMRSFSLPGSVIISPTNKRLELPEAVELMKRIKDELDIVMLANFGALGAKFDEWEEQALAFAEAGADIIELNFCCPNLATGEIRPGERHDHGGASIASDPSACRAIVTHLRPRLSVPIIAKVITGDPAALLASAKAIEEAGADGIHVVGTPIDGLPPLDEEGRPVMPLIEGVPSGSANGSVCRYSTFLATARLARALEIPIMASGGLDTWKDCVDVVMWGASAPSVCSAVMWSGWDVVRSMNEGIADFMAKKGYGSLEDFRGLALRHLTTPDRTRLIKGTSRVNEELCIGCGRCTRVGHCLALSLAETPQGRRARVDDDECVGCGVCWRLCPVDAISYVEKENS